MLAAIKTALETWLKQRRCNHRYRYSRSKPGTLGSGPINGIPWWAEA